MPGEIPMEDPRLCRVDVYVINYSPVRFAVTVNGETMLFDSAESCPLENSEVVALCSRLRAVRKAKTSLTVHIANITAAVVPAEHKDEGPIVCIGAIDADWEVALDSDEADALADVLESVAKAKSGHVASALKFWD